MGCTSSRCAIVQANALVHNRVGVSKEVQESDPTKARTVKPILVRDYTTTPLHEPCSLSFIENEEEEEQEEQNHTSLAHHASIHTAVDESYNDVTVPFETDPKSAEPQNAVLDAHADTQENLWICFVAAVELMRVQGSDLLAEIDPDDIICTAKQSAPNDQMTPRFDALSELSILLQSCSNVMGQLNMGFICHDRDSLIQCFIDTVDQANANGHYKLAMFSVSPSNHVYLSIFYHGRWYTWQTEPTATLRHAQPSEMIDHWMANVDIEEGMAIKTVTFLQNGQTTATRDADALTDCSSLSGDISSIYSTSQPCLSRSPTIASSGTNASSIDPLTFLCPISSEIMADPVTAADGYSYDRSSIEEHFSIHHYSPTTRQPISTELQDNWELRDIIHEYVENEANGIEADELEDFRHRRRLTLDRVERSMRDCQEYSSAYDSS